MCERLAKEGHSVVIIDNFDGFYSRTEKENNLAVLGRQTHLEFSSCNVATEGDEICALMGDTRPDVVIHLAARPGVRESRDEPLLYEMINIRGTLNVLEACRQANVRRLIFASSSSVYGPNCRLPLNESEHVWPLSPYGASKAAGEKLCFSYSQLHGVSIICLRLFSVYGPRQRPDLAIRKFAQAIQQQQSIYLYGDGLQARDYTFVDDIVNGIVAATNYDCQFAIFNLGAGHAVPLREMIRLLESEIGIPARLILQPAHAADVHITWADVGRANTALNYTPAVCIHDGIRRYLEWARINSEHSSSRVIGSS